MEIERDIKMRQLRMDARLGYGLDSLRRGGMWYKTFQAWNKRPEDAKGKAGLLMSMTNNAIRYYDLAEVICLVVHPDQLNVDSLHKTAMEADPENIPWIQWKPEMRDAPRYATNGRHRSLILETLASGEFTALQKAKKTLEALEKPRQNDGTREGKAAWRKYRVAERDVERAEDTVNEKTVWLFEVLDSSKSTTI